MAKLARNDDFISDVLYDISKSPKQLAHVYSSAHKHINASNHVGVLRRLKLFMRRAIDNDC